MLLGGFGFDPLLPCFAASKLTCVLHGWADAETAYDLACGSVDSIPCCLASLRLSLHASCTAGAKAETAYDLAGRSVGSIPCSLASLRLNLYASCTADADAETAYDLACRS